MAVYHWVRFARRRFLAIVDSDELRLFQYTVYFSMALSGFYMGFLGSPGVVRNELGALMNCIWVILTALGPVVAALGAWMVALGERRVLDAEACGGGGRIYWGWYLQLGGDFSVMMVCLAYVIAVFSASWLQRGIFAAFVISSLTLCGAILVLRDVRRIRAIERLPVV
ncbi:hypothetical protein [Nocardia wallacei]|uniref:hypothetical protein n=1 Tax=Nocardia wallacei TaxID=480035 RepID=UPI0024571CBC|nr:hypothetical protein [Nocardia wallacei]